MHKLKLYLSKFRLCRRKTKSPVMNHHLFSPFNPKPLEITYPATPSPPPTTPIHHCPHMFTTTTPESLNSPVTNDHTKTNSDKSTKKTEKKKKDTGSCDFVNKSGRKVKKISNVESLTVVKWSEQPYDDFKRSMLEMILEKEMFDANDLEQLLQSFLTLNSRHHHADIIAAFTEIWELLFA